MATPSESARALLAKLLVNPGHRSSSLSVDFVAHLGTFVLLTLERFFRLAINGPSCSWTSESAESNKPDLRLTCTRALCVWMGRSIAPRLVRMTPGAQTDAQAAWALRVEPALGSTQGELESS